MKMGLFAVPLLFALASCSFEQPPAQMTDGNKQAGRTYDYTKYYDLPTSLKDCKVYYLQSGGLGQNLYVVDCERPVSVIPATDASGNVIVNR